MLRIVSNVQKLASNTSSRPTLMNSFLRCILKSRSSGLLIRALIRVRQATRKGSLLHIINPRSTTFTKGNSFMPRIETLDYGMESVEPPHLPCYGDGLQGFIMTIRRNQAHSSHQFHSVQCNMGMVWVNRSDNKNQVIVLIEDVKQKPC